MLGRAVSCRGVAGDPERWPRPARGGLWGRVDRMVTDRAPWAPVLNEASTVFVSSLEAPETTSELLLGFTATAADTPPAIPTT